MYLGGVGWSAWISMGRALTARGAVTSAILQVRAVSGSFSSCLQLKDPRVAIVCVCTAIWKMPRHLVYSSNLHSA